jgi:hypothetical protein
VNFLHRYLGIALIAIFGIFGVWGLIAWFRNRDPGAVFWGLVATAQVGIGLQAVLGGILLVTAGRRPWLHYAYGVFPILLLVIAHRLSKRLAGLEWIGFAFAGLISVGLLLRAYTTGGGG